MKKNSFIIFLSVLVSAVEAGAQIEAGDLRLSVGFFSGGYTEYEVEDTEIEFSGVGTSSVSEFGGLGSGGLLQLGTAVTERFEIGANIAIGYQKVEVFDGDEDATNLRIGPYASMNFPLNSTQTVVASPVVGIGYSGLYSDPLDVNAFQLELGGEFKFFVAKDASIDLGLFFNYMVGKADPAGFGDVDIDGWMIGPRVKISIWP